MISCDLAGTRSLVTGAASGIGLATATLFARCGSRVALNDLPGNPNLAREVARLRDAGLDVMAAPGDVGDESDCKAMVSGAIDELGGLDHLVNNAGTPATPSPVPPRDLDAIDEDMWLKVLSVNLVGPYRCARTAAAALRQGGGAIVNTCSVAGLTGVGSSTALCRIEGRSHQPDTGPGQGSGAGGTGQCRRSRRGGQSLGVPLARRRQPGTPRACPAEPGRRTR